MERIKADIIDHLKEESVRKIVLIGDAGMGKTWMAREIRNHAISKGLCCAALWVSLNRKFDHQSFYGNIAGQLSLTSTTKEYKDDYGNEKEENPEILEKRIYEELERRRSSMDAAAGKFLLLILDGEGGNTDEEEITSVVEKFLPQNHQNLLKVLISGGKRDGDEVIQEGKKEIELKSLAEDMSLILFRQRVDEKVRRVQGFQKLAEAVAANGLPAGIIVMSGALNNITKRRDIMESDLDLALQKIGKYSASSNDVNPLLRCGYDFLEEAESNSMVNCFWHSIVFFKKYDEVHYNELITHWILEGYFASCDNVKKAYDEGHHVLMKLIDRGMLKKQEGNVIVIERALLEMIDHRRGGFGGTSSLGLPCVLENSDYGGLGRVTQSDGMIRTLLTGKKGEKVSTVVIDGSCLRREVLTTSIRNKQEIEVLAAFDLKLNKLPMDNLLVLVLRGCDLSEDMISDISKLEKLIVLEISGPCSLQKFRDDFFHNMRHHLRSLNLSKLQIKSLPPSLCELKELRWLVLRGCSQLEKLPNLRDLTNLEVLGLSGATSLGTFGGGDLAPLQKLQLVDLSKTKIKKLPKFQQSSKSQDPSKSNEFQNLKQLLLSGCDQLTVFSNLKSLPALQILDLSGASKINEIQSESLEDKDNLKILNLCGTGITKLPAPRISGLSELCISGCPKLVELPCTEALSELELLDLSNSSKLVKIEDESFEHLKYICHLNLSNTSVETLPSLSKLRNLRQLLLTSCSLLKCLPEIEGLEKLDKLDLSGCSSLTVINDNFFKQIPNLQKLGLSETKIKCLPFHCNPNKLSHLFLKNCNELETLPPPETFSNLKVLDLHGASSLNEIKAEYFMHMLELQTLDLSGVKAEFSGISNLTNLTELVLRGCPGLETAPFLDGLMRLEVLDLSETAVRSLPSLDNLKNLHKLQLKKCSSLEMLPSLMTCDHLEVLEVSGTSIKKLPVGFAGLTRLKCLSLPDLKLIQEVGWGKIKCLPQELDWDQCSISEPAVTPADSRKSSIWVKSAKFFLKLEEKYFKQLFFSVHSPQEHGNNGDSYWHRDELTFGEISFGTTDFCHYKERGQALEIFGFKNRPDGVESILRHAEYISLVENEFLKNLLDLGADNLEKMKGCWLESCNEMKSIVNGEKGSVGVMKHLEILWVSNLCNLESLYAGKGQPVGFSNLKHLHIEFCPEIKNVFPSSELPENLETIDIKFCDKLKTVFSPNGSAACKSVKLHELNLLQLPELEVIGAIPPSAYVFQKGCPKLRLSGSVNSTNASLEITAE